MPETVSAGIAAPPRREFLGVAAYTVFPQAGSAKLARVNLGGHPKSGQWWSPQNRPIEISRDKVVIARSDVLRQVLFFGDLTFPCGAMADLRYLGGGYGNAGKRPERRLRG